MIVFQYQGVLETMSIVLPGDSPIGKPLQTESERDFEYTPLFSRLRGLSLWQFLTEPRSLPELPNLRAPVGKIRIVSNRWDDRPSKYRCDKDKTR